MESWSFGRPIQRNYVTCTYQPRKTDLYCWCQSILSYYLTWLIFLTNAKHTLSKKKKRDLYCWCWSILSSYSTWLIFSTNAKHTLLYLLFSPNQQWTWVQQAPTAWTTNKIPPNNFHPQVSTCKGACQFLWIYFSGACPMTFGNVDFLVSLIVVSDHDQLWVHIHHTKINLVKFKLVNL